MTLSVLSIACSPRRNGNTTSLLLKALNTVQSEGHKTELIYLSDLNIKPCKAVMLVQLKGYAS